MRLRALWSVANDLRPFYDEKAKDRQVRKVDSVLEKIPEQKDAPTARDEAGKVAGINGRYVDMASDVHLVDQALQLVMRTNKRRNLNSGQWATIAVEAEEVMSAIAEQVEKGKSKRVSEARQGEVRQKIAEPQKLDDQKTATKAAELFQTNRTYINQAAKIQKASPEVFAKVKIQKGLRA